VPTISFIHIAVGLPSPLVHVGRNSAEAGALLSISSSYVDSTIRKTALQSRGTRWMRVIVIDTATNQVSTGVPAASFARSSAEEFQLVSSHCSMTAAQHITHPLAECGEAKWFVQQYVPRVQALLVRK
jgi:hypothetical protein